MSQYIHDQWESDRGFPGGAVSGITQTADGFLWIAAEKGLVRFDGLTFRLVQPPRLTSDLVPAVLAVGADADGSLLVQLRNARLMRYRHGQFEDVQSDSTQLTTFVTAMSRGLDGAMLLAVLDYGVVAMRNGQSAYLVSQRAMPSSFVISMAPTIGGGVWLGTRDSGLLRVQPGNVTAITSGLPDQKINSLLTGDRQDLWIGTDNGVVRWNGAEVTRAGLPESLEHVAALAMIRDRDANVWIGSAEGLLRINSRGVAKLEESGHGPRSTVTTVFEDRDHNVWFGTNQGIERLRDGVFRTYSPRQGLPPGGYGPVYADADRTWFAPLGGGLFYLRDGQVTSVPVGGLDNDVIYSIAGAPDGVWIARQRGGLAHVRADGQAFTVRRYTQRDGLAQDNVFAVHRARDGSVWAGTLSGGVSSAQGWNVHDLHHRPGAGIEHRRRHHRVHGRHDVVCDPERCQRSVTHRLASICGRRRTALE